MDKQDLQTLHELHSIKYGDQALRWYGWGSPVGLGLLLVSIGLFLWLLHLAHILH